MFVRWIEHALLPVAIPAVAKFVIVCAAALVLSWGCSAGAGRSPLIARIV